MKLLTKEQEQAHYNETLKGGAIGGFIGLGAGAGLVAAASMRYAFFRQLTLPLKAFLVTSGATFGGIITADHYSHAYEKANNPKDLQFQERQKERREADIAGKSFTQRAVEFGKKERYKIVGASWVASMFTAFALVNRNKYLSGQQKLVQARVYAQFLTLGVLVASAAFEISDRKNETGRYETVQIVDPNDPEHKRMIEKRREIGGDSGDELWKDMVAAEEQRIKEREDEEKQYRKQTEKKSSDGDKKKSDKSKVDKKDESKDKGDKKDGSKNKQDKKDDGGDKQEKKNADKKSEKKDNSQGKK